MIALASTDPEENRRRAYAITVVPSLFHRSRGSERQFTLICQWGRTDSGLHQRRTYLLNTRREALEKAQAIVRQRLRHGYEIIQKGHLYNELANQGMLSSSV